MSAVSVCLLAMFVCCQCLLTVFVCRQCLSAVSVNNVCRGQGEEVAGVVDILYPMAVLSWVIMVMMMTVMTITFIYVTECIVYMFRAMTL